MANLNLPQIRMRRPNLESLADIPLVPEGYVLTASDPADADTIAELMNIAFESNDWTAEKVLNELIKHPQCGPTYVVKHGARAVATATLLLEPETNPGAGVLHWVASDKAHRGKQLGLIVSLAVLHEAKRRGCSYSLLLTDDARLPAIKTYLKLGYEPDCWHASHEQRWVEIRQALGK